MRLLRRREVVFAAWVKYTARHREKRARVEALAAESRRYYRSLREDAGPKSAILAAVAPNATLQDLLFRVPIRVHALARARACTVVEFFCCGGKPRRSSPPVAIDA